jgi:DNA-binding beta-propeller fold protein YncE
MLGVDLTNGGIAWRNEDDASRLVAAQELSDTESLIVTLFEIYRVETKTGTVKWKAPVSGKASAQLAKLGGLGTMLKQAADAQTEGMEFNVMFLLHAEKDAFVIGSEEQNSSMSGSTTPTYSCNFMYYSLADGKELWKQPAQMNGRLSHAIVESDGLIVLPDNGLLTNINKFDFATATGQWGKKGRGTRIKGGVYRFVETPKGYLLITSTGNNNFINFLDPATGTLTFEKPVKINGEVVGTAAIASNIMYATSEETNILDPATGSLKFGKPVNAVASMIRENDEKIFLYDIKDGHIKTIDKTGGELSILTKTPIKFEGKESPSAMELRENGIFIHSSQNVALIGNEGQVVYQKFFPAPREPGITRALLYAQAVRAAYISAAASYASAAFTVAAEQSKQNNDQVGGAMLGAVGEGYGQLGSAAGAFAAESFKRANARKKASSSGRDFMVIMTQEAKETLLIKVNKNTGNTDGKISLGKDNTPVYTVDDVTGQVFLKSDKTNILSYAY